MSLAAAQSYPPRVLLIFDTSGSMGVDVETGNPTGGDNSRTYPGVGTSRLAVAKDAIRGLVETTSEAEFALMRYPQLQGLGINRGVLDGRQSNTYQGLADTPLNYAGECDGATRAAGPDVAFSLLTPFGDGNERAIAGWMDHREAFPQDPELRAEGPTPIATTLGHAEDYLRTVIAADEGARCRRYAVVLLTDGGESCLPRADREAALQARAEALRTIEVDLNGVPVVVDVRTYVVAFSVNLLAAQQLSAVVRAGGTGRVPYTAEDLTDLQLAFAQILNDAIPVEQCNGEDDDCDGRIDEGALNACGQCGAAPVERCDGVDEDCDGRIDEGTLNACGGCGPLPDEICNTLDDDCDGRVDEAVANACGGCAAVRPEVCNNLDDDCDGWVDNVPGVADPLVRPCGRSVGECSEGVEQCVAGRWGGCTGQAPTPEKCDVVDNDCDGESDEATQPCGMALEIGEIGECRLGRRGCDPTACAVEPAACANDGWLEACVGAVDPAEEICDGRDNDCDGAADEGLFNPCGACGPTPAEACNGLDDNCDGRIDEAAQCPPGYACFAAACARPCEISGECSDGFYCRSAWPGGRFCHPDPCAGVRCSTGQRCDSDAGRCVDPCEGIECDPGEGCDLGACVPRTCRHDGCPDGAACIGDSCVADACAAVVCADDQACQDGRCIGACRERTCGVDLRCEDGSCLEDACGGRCIQGQICDPTDGSCAQDPCFAVACPPGMACEAGACRSDAACLTIRCPLGTVCEAGHCTDFTPGVWPLGSPVDAEVPDAQVMKDGAVDAARPDVGVADDASLRRRMDAEPSATDDGGGGCSVSPRPGLPAAPLLSLLLLGVLRRRSQAVRSAKVQQPGA